MHSRLALLVFALVAVAGVVALVDGAARATAGNRRPTLDVVGAMFRVTTADGRLVEDHRLVGAVLDLAVDGEPVRGRIAAVSRDPMRPEGDVVLYDVRVTGEDGTERPLCAPGPDGIAAGFPIAGRLDGKGDLVDGGPGDFEFVCTGGARGKCVRFGYRPWASAPGGGRLRDLYNACVRMVRADWCGDGRSHTVDGTLIGFTDGAGVNTPEDAVRDPDWSTVRFEAAWTTTGATCVAKPRLPGRETIEDIVRACPRLAGHVGPRACAPGGEALLESWSR